MLIIFKLLFVLDIIGKINAILAIKEVAVRAPNQNDIGLIMDLTATNTIENDQRDLIEFSVRSEKPCRLHLCNDIVIEDGGHVVGGNFGSIEAGASETVSLYWPTVSLFNRVGSCSIIVKSKNSKNEESELQHEIKFDTRFITLDPDSTGWRKAKNYVDCQNYDLDFLNDCRPVDCEERYFGKRSFFNKTIKACQEVPCCVGETLYDPYANECVDSQYTVSKDDIKDIKAGKFRSYQEWLKETTYDSIPAAGENPDLNSNNQKRETEDINVNDPDAISSEGSYFLKGIFDGLVLVFATIGIYVLICLIIFFIVSCVSKHRGDQISVTFSRTPTVTEKSIRLPSRSSYLTRRCNK